MAAPPMGDEPCYLVLVPPRAARVLWRSFLSFKVVNPVGSASLANRACDPLPWMEDVLGEERPMKYAINAPGAPETIGPYSQGTTAGRLVFASGQLPIDAAHPHHLVEGGIREQTEQVIHNCRVLLEATGCTLDDVAQTNVYLADMTLHEVNEVYAAYFSMPAPARTVVEPSMAFPCNNAMGSTEIFRMPSADSTVARPHGGQRPPEPHARHRQGTADRLGLRALHQRSSRWGASLPTASSSTT